MRAHFAEVYSLWALTIYAMAVPGLIVGLVVERLWRRPGPAYLGEWPDDYDVLEDAQVMDDDYADAQANGLEAIRRLSFR